MAFEISALRATQWTNVFRECLSTSYEQERLVASFVCKSFRGTS